MKKFRRILIVAAVILLVAGVVIAAVLLFRKSYVETNDPDALYPYTIQKDRGRITVTVQSDFPEGAFFHASGLTGATAVSEKKSTAKKAVFEVKAVSEGTDTVSLYLEKAGTFTERLYAITLYLLVENDKEITVTGSRSIALGNTLSKTEGEGICYFITCPGAGLCDISLVKQAAEDSFVLTTDNPDLFRILSQESEETRQTYRLSATAVGDATVTFLCEDRGSALSMKVHVTDALQFTVYDVKESAYDSKGETSDREKQEAEALIGAFSLPESAAVQGYHVLMTDEEGPRTAAVTFTEGEKSFTFFASLKMTLPDFIAYFRPDTDPEPVKTATLSASGCPMEDGYMLFWTSASGKTCGLGAPTREDALSCLENLQKADPSLQ